MITMKLNLFIFFKNGSQLYDIGNAVGQSLSVHEKINFLSNTWIPDSNYVFPLKQEGKQQMRKFGVHWLQQYNWLAYSESKTGGFCKFCVLFAPDGAGMGSQVRIK